MKRLIFLALSLLSLSTPMSHAADTPLTYDRINLGAAAQGKAANDLLVAVLFQRSEGPQAEPLAADVNKAIAAAVEQARKVAEVSVQTLNYQTQPTYQNQKVNGWSVQQSIRLESRSPEKLGRLIGELQKTLKVESVSYEISPESLHATQDRLISEALKAFQLRAERITQDLGRKRYRLVNLDVNTVGSAPPPAFRMAPRAMVAETASPALEAGEQTVTVTVQGTIELQAD